MNTSMAERASERLDAQIADALFGQPGMSKMDVANRLRELRGDRGPLLVEAGNPVSASPADQCGLNYERMFVDACAALAEVSRELGCDPELGGPDPILTAIAELRAALAARQLVGQGPVTVAYGPISLPPVPHGQVMPPDDRNGLYPVAHDDEAMRDYAREAVEADREQLAAGIAHVKGAVLIDGAVTLIQKGDELAWARGHVDGRKAALLYAAPPAQAVDLGQFRKAVMVYRNFSRSNEAESDRLLALIDSKAVSP